MKKLIEERNAKQAEMDSLLETASTELRGFNEEEEAKFNKLEEEVRGLNTLIARKEAAKEAAPKEEIENIEEKREEQENMENEKRELTQEELVQAEKRALADFLRNKDTAEARDIQTGTHGEVIPTHLHNTIVEKIFEVAPLFSRCRAFTATNGPLEILKETENLGTAAWVGEMTDLTPSDFKMAKVKLEQNRCGSVIVLSQHIINDSGIDIVEYATRLLARRLGWVIDRTMITGVKTSDQFEGLNSLPAACQIETAGSGVITEDDLLDMYNDFNPYYLDDTAFVMNRKTFKVISKLKNSVGDYILIPKYNEKTKTASAYEIFGRPVIINDACDDITAGKMPIFLVNMADGYASMIKKGVEFKHIAGDTQNALKGSHTLMIDMYADAKILNEAALRGLKIKA